MCDNVYYVIEGLHTKTWTTLVANKGTITYRNLLIEIVERNCTICEKLQLSNNLYLLSVVPGCGDKTVAETGAIVPILCDIPFCVNIKEDIFFQWFTVGRDFIFLTKHIDCPMTGCYQGGFQLMEPLDSSKCHHSTRPKWCIRMLFITNDQDMQFTFENKPAIGGECVTCNLLKHFKYKNKNAKTIMFNCMLSEMLLNT